MMVYDPYGNLVGKIFNYLEVIEYLGQDNNKRRHWKCRCLLCGKEVNLLTNRLVGKNPNKSCGCYRSINMKDMQKKKRQLHREEIEENPILSSGFNRLFRTYKRNAKNKNLKFSLDKKYFFELTRKNCYYCGSSPSNLMKERTLYSNYIYNGIDRVDNNKGYSKNNVVPCCKICNQAKHALSKKEFLIWVKKLFYFQKEKNDNF